MTELLQHRLAKLAAGGLFGGLLLSIAGGSLAQSPVDGEIDVQSATGVRLGLPGVAVADDGSFVLLWEDRDAGLVGQSFRPDGGRRGALFQVATDNSPGWGFTVESDADGDLAVVWHGMDGATRGQLFDRVGKPRGASFQVATAEYYGRDFAMSPAGELVVVWSEYLSRRLKARRFDRNGTGLGAEFTVSEELVGYVPSVAWEPRGGFVVTWSSGLRQGDNVFARRFDSAGNGVADSFQVNTYTPGSQYLSDLAMAADGSFVVVWQSRLTQDDVDLFGQRFDRAGARVGAEFQVNRHVAGRQTNPSVVSISSADFVVVWESPEQDDYGAGIIGQRFSANGRRGAEFVVNTGTLGDQSQVAVAIGDDGTVVVAWHSLTPGATSDAIRAQRYRFRAEGGGDPGGDADQDGISNGTDNCPTVSNPEQTDVAGDGYGDDCVSPDVVIPPTSHFGANPVIGPGTTIQTGVDVGDDAILGEHVLLDRFVRVGHRFSAGDFVSVGRRVALGNDVSIGFASRIEAAVTIGDSVVIGDQVVIRRNVVVGSDARIEDLVVVLAGARIGEGATIEMGARIGRGATVRPGAVVPTGTTVPPATTFP